MTGHHEFLVNPDGSGNRLDRFLVMCLENPSRSLIQEWLEKGLCLLNGKICQKASIRLKTGDRVELEIPEPVLAVLNREGFPLPIVHETASYLVVVKPAGLLTHPGGPHDSRQSVAGIFASRVTPESFSALDSVSEPAAGKEVLEEDATFYSSAEAEVFRPGIVHRLDRDTSGLLILALTPSSRDYFSSAFKNREIQKTYRAIVRGVIREDSGEIDAPLGRSRGGDRKKFEVLEGGRSSQTSFQILDRCANFTEVQVFPKTGRTHQIRVHFQYIGHPLVNDPLYCRKTVNLSQEGQLLSAESIAFRCPDSGERVSLHTEPDLRFAEFRKKFWE